MIGSSPTDLTGKFALDIKGLGDLKQSAKAGSPEALRGAATQFEAMFINMMMKSMRDATPQEGPMDSQTTKTFTTMLDQQMSQNLARRGVGLADVLVRQLTAQSVNAQALAIGGGQAGAGNALGGQSAFPTALNASALLKNQGAVASPAPTEGVSASGRKQSPHVRAFQEKLGVHAEAASRATGIPAKFMLGQAALESGWGRREIKHADGSNSHNLFGVKAGAGWTGKVATAVTTEYVNGHPQTRVEKFRAYDSYADAFKDYGNMISRNPRYEKVMASGGDAAAFAHGLQRAGYATDPHYAAKLSSIIKRSLA
jgi:flagellar protein FlgJ